MRAPRLVRVALLAAGALAIGAAASPAASVARSDSVVVHKPIQTPGVYKVNVEVSSNSAQTNLVKLTIGGVKRSTTTAKHRRHTTVSLLVRISGASLTIRAVGHASRPKLAVSLRRLAALALPPVKPDATHASSTPAPVTPPPPPPPPPAQPPASGPPPPITSWVQSNSTNFTPLSDQAAGLDVITAPETRPGNAAENATMPSQGQLQSFYDAIDYWGRSVVQANPYYQYVTGHYTGTTDEIIQWAAWKWGIPEDWLRAQYVQESFWHMSGLGDVQTVSASVYNLYPSQARIPGTLNVYQTMGISQIKWSPDGQFGAGTEPLRWKSTAFAVDYEAATIRFYFDDPLGLRTSWGDPSYVAGQTWNSIGAWYESFPWNSTGQQKYIVQVQGRLSNRTWAQPGF